VQERGGPVWDAVDISMLKASHTIELVRSGPVTFFVRDWYHSRYIAYQYSALANIGYMLPRSDETTR
jgi:hypothetical protein